MPEYVYQGVDRSGKKISGKMDVPGEGDLRMALREMGIRPTRIQKSSTSLNSNFLNIFKGGLRNVPIEVLVIFTRQLQLLIGSGIPIVQGLEILSGQTEHSTMRSIIMALQEKIAQGSYMWEALSAYPQVFPKLYVSLIRAGEVSGSIDQMLKRLSRYLEDADRIKKMIKSAMMYPLIVMGIGIGVISLMLVFVIPKFEEMLTQSGQALPLPTQIVIESSHYLAKNIFYIIGILGFGTYLVIRYIKSDEGRAVRDRILFRMPLFGNLMQKGGIARFSRTMQTLLVSGVNLIDAIDICKMTVDNAVLEDAISKIRSEVEAGKTLGMVISRLDVFPKMAVQMITVGESTGNLDKMLEKVADFYETEVENTVAGLSKLIEPIVLVFLGGTVGGMLISMYLPIFKLAGGAQ